MRQKKVDAFEQKVRYRFYMNTAVSIILAVVVTLLSLGNHPPFTAVLRGGGIGLLVFLYFYLSYRRLLR